MSAVLLVKHRRTINDFQLYSTILGVDRHSKPPIPSTETLSTILLVEMPFKQRIAERS